MSKNFFSRLSARALPIAAVIGGHAVCTMLLLRPSISVRPLPGAQPITAELYTLQPETTLTQFEPEISSPAIRIPMPQLPDEMTVATTDEPPLESPLIDPQFAPSVSEYSQLAGLAEGEKAVVTLTVDVGADGAVIAARVARSNASDAANSAAIAYARATRWIPGSIGGVPQAMQASLTVILGERA